MPSSFATVEGTARYRQRFPKHAPHQFYRNAQGLAVSSLGLGSYLGNMDDAASRGYVESVKEAVRGGINFIDTSLNYRHQMSEQDIGKALRELFDSGEFQRDEIVICTKAGYLVPNALPESGLDPAEIAGRMHCLAPDFLADQMSRSIRNLGTGGIDVFYLHNPETQLQYVPRDRFESRMSTAFLALEGFARQGAINWYGIATWNGLRVSADEGIVLTHLAGLAAQAGGQDHRFRFIQLPVNLAMVEAASLVREPWDGGPISTLDAARRLGITAIASASILQSRLASGLPDQIREELPGLETDAQRAIQFARSVPGITVALTGMSNPAHVTENLKLAATAPASLSAWFRPSL